jgi:hypothetical protein
MSTIRRLITILAVAAPLGLAACGTTAKPEARPPAPAVPSKADIARAAVQYGLTGLSPESLAPIAVCHGLSPASVAGCGSAELATAMRYQERPHD